MTVNAYHKNVAAIYDLIYADSSGDVERMVEYLKALTPGDRVLELAVGTGRLAFPLARGGFEVTGVDNSHEMLGVLEEKNSTGVIRSLHGDMINGEPLREGFDLVLLMCNTLFVANNHSEQLRIFENAAESLDADGFFVLETFNPLPYVNPTKTNFHMRRLTREISLLEQFTIDPVAQRLDSFNVILESAGSFTYEESVRFMFPHEMDAVAAQAGFSLDRRVSDWGGARYEAHSPRNISVYQKNVI